MKENLISEVIYIKSLPKLKHHGFSLRYLFIVLFIFCSNHISTAQGDPYEYDEGYLSAFEETDLYIDSYNKRRNSIYEETPYSSGGGYLGIGISSGIESLSTSPPQEISGPPSTPTYPDVPVSNCKEFLILIGLGLAVYKLSFKPL